MDRSSYIRFFYYYYFFEHYSILQSSIDYVCMRALCTERASPS